MYINTYVHNKLFLLLKNKSIKRGGEAKSRTRNSESGDRRQVQPTHQTFN